MMGASAPPFRVFVPGLLYMAFSFYDSGDSWSGKLSKSIAIIAYSLDEFAIEGCGSVLHRVCVGTRLIASTGGEGWARPVVGLTPPVGRDDAL